MMVGDVRSCQRMACDADQEGSCGFCLNYCIYLHYAQYGIHDT
jgi:hypothetical protein